MAQAQFGNKNFGGCFCVEPTAVVRYFSIKQNVSNPYIQILGTEANVALRKYPIQPK